MSDERNDAGAAAAPEASGTSDEVVRGTPPLWFPGAGFAIGFIGSLCGIGGGLFAGPLLHTVRRLPLARAAASALPLVLATTLAATVTEALRTDSYLSLDVVLCLAAGALVGAQLGFRVATRLDGRTLKMVFVVVLALAGARVLFGGASDPTREAMLDWSLVELAIAFGVGLGGGFVAPLLGVGGGLFMVPGLYLGLPALGFPGARALALAAGVVAGTRSLWLHAKAGRVHLPPALRLAIGALFGAGIGAMTVRTPWIVETGRVLLGLVLWFVALRFARDLRSSRNRSTASSEDAYVETPQTRARPSERFEAMLARLEPSEAVALHSLSFLPRTVLPALATNWLSAGIDTPTIRSLAGESDLDEWEESRHWSGLASELDLSAPPRAKALQDALCIYLRAIASGDVDAFEGMTRISCDVHAAAADDFPDVEHVGAGLGLEKMYVWYRELQDATDGSGSIRSYYVDLPPREAIRRFREHLFEEAKERLAEFELRG